MPTRSRAAFAGFAFSLLLARPASAQQSHAAADFYALPADAADAVGVRSEGVAAAVRSPIAAPTSRAVVLQTTRGAQSSSPNEQRARARFEAGVHFADSLQWSEAADAFEESWIW